MTEKIEPALQLEELVTVAEPKKSITDEEILELYEKIKALDADIPDEIALTLEGQAPWSASKMKCLQKCPFQYYLKYVLKFKLPADYQIQDDPLSANLGKAAHEILEVLVIGKPLDAAYKIVKERYVGKKILTEQEWVDGVDSLYYNIHKFEERITTFSRQNPVKRVLTELRMAITRDYQPTGFFSDDVWFRGVIDLILMLVCKDVIIIDHKKGGGMGGTRYYEEQLNIYKILFHFGVEPVTGAQSGIHFIEAGEVNMADYHNSDQIESDLKTRLEWNMQGAIDTVKEIGFFKHKRGGPCKWCEYDKAGCKSGVLKPLELSTKRFFNIKPI